MKFPYHAIARAFFEKHKALTMYMIGSLEIKELETLLYQLEELKSMVAVVYADKVITKAE